MKPSSLNQWQSHSELFALQIFFSSFLFAHNSTNHINLLDSSFLLVCLIFVFTISFLFFPSPFWDSSTFYRFYVAKGYCRMNKTWNLIIHQRNGWKIIRNLKTCTIFLKWMPMQYIQQQQQQQRDCNALPKRGEALKSQRFKWSSNFPYFLT